MANLVGSEADLSALIPPEDWELNRRVLSEADRAGVRYALGGGLAFSAYSGRWRNTKDMDLYILPEDREKAVAAVTRSGFEDYFDRLEYDRSWIYRGYRDGVIVDLIWQFANHRTAVDESWLACSEQVVVRGDVLRLIPPEEMIWSKLYVLQRDRCDWPDLLNILHARGPGLDWARLLQRLGPDVALLGGLLAVFGWMCPARARQIPTAVWRQVGLAIPDAGPDCTDNPRQVSLLDTRDWFGPRRDHAPVTARSEECRSAQ